MTADNSPETRFENYTILQNLGAGAFSKVYLAEQLSTGQKVALKVLNLDTDGERDTVEARIVRFKREMKLCAELNHTNIVKVLDFGKSSHGELFTVFEYIPGKTLGDLIREEGALSVKRAFRIMDQVLSAVSAAHEKDIIHRDIKPDNIMVSIDDSVKLLDFGISRFVNEDKDAVRVTLTQDFLGTPAYSAPEQVRGDSVNFKADIFAWGLIFIECLTGENAYNETNKARLVQKQLSKSPVPLPTSLSSTPFGHFLTWILQKDPQRRAAETKEVLRRFRLIPYESVPNSSGFLKARDKTVHEFININKEEYKALTRQKISTLYCEFSIEDNSAEQSSQFIDCLFFECFELCRSIAESNGAYTASMAGGRIIFYFGYPSEGEFHIRSAAKTALDISSSLVQSERSLSVRHNVQLTWKMGLHTGDITIRKSFENEQLFGKVLSESSQICSRSRPNEITAGFEVYSLLQKSFNFHKIDENFYRLTGMREVQGLFSRYKNEQLHGRNIELSRLEAIRQRSLHEGQAVIIQGEAGIGKSRFMAESVTSTAIERSAIYELLCFPENKNSSLAPFLDFLRKYFKIDEYDNEEQRDISILNELEDCSFNSEEYISLLYFWLGVNSNQFPPLEIAPIKLRDLFFENTVKLFLEHILEAKSTLIFDDLHWADPTSLELLSLILKDLHRHSCIILMSARPEFISPWNEKLISIIQLEGLEEDAVSTMIRSRLDQKNLPDDYIKTIIRKVDGNPLFAEEVVKVIASVEDISTLEQSVPNSLKELFSDRLRKIGEAKLTAQLASVIGRRFTYDLLREIHPNGEGILLADLTQLLAAGFIHVIPSSDTLEYVFHHALVCDNAYESIDSEECRGIHSKIAEILEQKYRAQEKSEDFVPIIRDIAHHFLRSENYEEALEYHFKYGRQLLRLSAYKEALDYFRTALRCYEKLSKKDDRKELEIRLKIALCLKTIYGWDYPEAALEYDRTIALSEKLGGELVEELAPVIFGRWVALMMRLEFDKALVLARQYLKFAESTESDEVLMQAHLTLANNLYWIGSLKETHEQIQKSLAYHQKLNSEELIEKVGYEPVTMAYMFDVFCNWHFGHYSKADELLKEYMASVEALNHPFSNAIMIQAAAWHWYHVSNSEKCLQYSLKLIQVSEEFNLPFYKGIGMLFSGWSKAIEGDAEVGLEEITEANDKYINPEKGRFFNSVYACTKAEALCCLGREKEAQQILREAVELAIQANEKCYLSELYRLLAEASLGLEKIEEAENMAQSSVKTAAEMGMLSYQLKSSLDLNSILLISDNTSEITALAQLLKSFDPEENSTELSDARQLVDEIL